MRQDIRSSIWARLLALSFIVLILLGNVWFVLFVTGQRAPVWLYSILAGTMGSALLFGVLLGCYAIMATPPAMPSGEWPDGRQTKD
jgi:hypothetical protein